MLPLHEDSRTGSISKQIMGEGKAFSQPTDSNGTDQHQPCILAGIYQAKMQAETGQNHTVPHQDEETQVKKTEETRSYTEESGTKRETSRGEGSGGCPD